MDRNELIPYAGREQAWVKHFLLESYLVRVIMITARSKYQHIAYVDAFAGPWKSAQEDLSDTSFSKAIEVMESCRVTLAQQFRRSVSFRALFVERDPERYARLKAFADSRSTAQIEIRAINEDFAQSAETVAAWIRPDEMGFVLVDPTGWKTVVAPATLAPLLRKPNVELLINVMWNFVSLATGHTAQQENLREVFGSELESLIGSGLGGSYKAEKFMRAYVEGLRGTAGMMGGRARLRTAWFPVEFPNADRVFYYLVYATHHVKGIVTFLEESDRAREGQREMKFAMSQAQREKDSGISDFFGDVLNTEPKPDAVAKAAARAQWLAILPHAGSQIRVDETVIAEMSENGGCLISQLQSSLREFIEAGDLSNLDAKKLRKRNVVDYRAGETVRRVK